MTKKPKCKICPGSHWSYEGHDYSGLKAVPSYVKEMVHARSTPLGSKVSPLAVRRSDSGVPDVQAQDVAVAEIPEAGTVTQTVTKACNACNKPFKNRGSVCNACRQRAHRERSR